jgi:hypothetical protein
MERIIEPTGEPQFLRITLRGHLSEQGVKDVVGEVMQNPVWWPGIGLLYDIRNVSVREMTLTDVRGISDFFREFRDQFGPSKVAVLVDSPIKYGLARQFILMAEPNGPPNLNVFKTENEAHQWLSDRTAAVSDIDDTIKLPQL